MDNIEALMIVTNTLAFFSAVVLVVYFVVRSLLRQKQMTHEERMLAIEKGVDIPLYPVSKKKEKRRLNPYVWPLIFLGAGLALTIGSLMEGDTEITKGLVLIFIGAGWLTAFKMLKKDNGTKKEYELDENEKESVV